MLWKYEYEMWKHARPNQYVIWCSHRPSAVFAGLRETAFKYKDKYQLVYLCVVNADLLLNLTIYQNSLT